MWGKMSKKKEIERLRSLVDYLMAQSDQAFTRIVALERSSAALVSGTPAQGAELIDGLWEITRFKNGDGKKAFKAVYLPRPEYGTAWAETEKAAKDEALLLVRKMADAPGRGYARTGTIAHGRVEAGPYPAGSATVFNSAPITFLS